MFKGYRLKTGGKSGVKRIEQTMYPMIIGGIKWVLGEGGTIDCTSIIGETEHMMVRVERKSKRTDSRRRSE